MPQTIYTKAETDAKLALIPKGPKGDRGAPGPVGPEGPAGPPGPAGDADLTDYYTKAQIDALFAIQASQINALQVRVLELENPDLPPPVDPLPEVGVVPFAGNSNWNTKVPTNATYTDVAELHQGGGWMSKDSYSSPLVISKPTDPIVTINANASWGWPAQTLTVRIPTGITGSPGTDGSLIVVDGSTSYDFWQFSRSGNTATCRDWAKADLVNGTGWGTANPFRGAGIHASGSALYAGLIVGNELTAGINHALAMSISKWVCSQDKVNGAIGSDGGGSRVPMGARFAIPRNQAAPASQTAQGKVLWKAFQEHGGYVCDTYPASPQAFMLGADPLSVPDADANAVLGPDWTAKDLEAISLAMKRIS